MAKSARWLWRRIKEVLSLLVAAGIEAGRVEDRTGSKITLRKLPKNDATNATGDENREGKKTDGIKAEDDATANATTGKSNATDGNSADSNATSNATANADSYAGSGNSGNRNGSTWEADPMRAYRRGGTA
jgi:hypothetical protein